MKCSSFSARLRIPSSEEEAAEREAEGIDFLDKRRRKFNLRFFQLKAIFTGVIVAAMGCFFGCFGVNKDSSSNPNLQDSSPLSTTPAVKVGAVNRNRSPLSSLFLSEANDDTPTKLKQDQDLGTPKPELGFNLKELNDQAKFLKACGTLSETPAEIRQATEKWQDLSAQEGDHKHSRFTSWLTNTSIEKPNIEIISDRPPTPIKNCEQWVDISGSLEHTPSSCMTGRQIDGRVSTSSIEGNKNDGSIEIISSPSNSFIGSSVTPSDIAPTVAGMKKSVRFDCDSDTSSIASKSHPSETYSENSKQFGSAATPSVAKSSPYPTPLKLSDDMQTPGTIFPAYLDAMGQGKNTHVRSQYVYSVLNPVGNISHWKELKDEDPSFGHQNSLTRESSEQIDEKTPVPEMVIGKASLGQGTKVEASLSSWHGAPLPDPDGNAEHSGSAVGENFHCGRTPGDRPILGMVAAHWNYDEPQVSPKWWDGNGIPNSTNKYKEDQKVSWHATPFEERLEKALSEDTLFPQRNQSSRTPPPDFNETEESDTGLSQLQPSNHFKSVASF